MKVIFLPSNVHFYEIAMLSIITTLTFRLTLSFVTY